MRRGVVLLGAALSVLHGCSCDGSVTNAPGAGAVCAQEMPPEGCGQPCGEGLAACATGMYCAADGTCTADCVPGGSATCGTGYRCTSFGRCVEDPDLGRDSGGRDPNVCADVRLEATRVTPRVILIIDQSGSMTEDFGAGTRWEVLRDSLLADDGLIRALEDQVEFGLALYSAISGPDDLPEDPDMCPLITWVDPALDNYDAIATVYGPADPIEETPTGDAIWSVLERIGSVPDPDLDPTIFVLATDGEPDRCEQLNPQNGQAEAVAAVEDSHAAGIRTYVISVGRDISESHLQDVANAGLGHGSGDPDAPFWVAGDDVGLRDALRDIVGGVLSCRVDLDGTIDTDMACSGTVELNGRAIPCDDPNGWRVVDEDTIELQGDSCDELQSGVGATLEARFPCDVVLI